MFRWVVLLVVTSALAAMILLLRMRVEYSRFELSGGSSPLLIDHATGDVWRRSPEHCWVPIPREHREPNSGGVTASNNERPKTIGELFLPEK